MVIFMDMQPLYDAILNGNHKAAREMTEEALGQGKDPQFLVNDVMIPAMNAVGHKYEINEYYVPELLLSARAMKASLELIRPLLAARGAELRGRVILGTVQGDLHDIGKNLVGAMLEGAGFEVIDLGVDVAPEKFVAEARRANASIVGLSALLTTTMPTMRSVIKAFADAGIRDSVRIFIGGAPTTQAFADDIGADGHSRNAIGAVALARSFRGQPS